LEKLAAFYLIFFVTALALPMNSGLAQTRTVGVSVGDTFKYTYNFEYNISNSTDVTLPTVLEPFLEQAKTIDWAQMSILNISGTSVTAQTLLHFNNGTEQSSIGTTDVTTGQGNLTLFLIASNLNQNDSLYTANSGTDTINETVMRNYPSGSRQLNHQNIITDYNVTQDELAGFNMTGFQQHNTQDVFWDRQLGVLVEMSYNMMSQSQTFNANISLKIELIESNALVLPEFPTLLPVFIVLSTSGIATIVYRRKR
jgi:hypothetical protein